MDRAPAPSPQLVLLVEDHPPTRKAMGMLLRHMDCRVIEAGTVAEAMASLSANPARLVLDLMLPDGNGVVLLRHVRVNNLPIRVAVATGATDPSMLAEVEALRPDVLYRKPVDVSAMATWLAA